MPSGGPRIPTPEVIPTPRQLARLIEDYRAGMRYWQIWNRYGWGARVIRRLMRKHGIEKRAHGWNRRYVEPKEWWEE